MMDETSLEPAHESNPPPLIAQTWKQFLYGFLVIAAPIFNFTFVDWLKPEWQTGKFSDYIDLFLLPEASFFFFIMIAYAVISYIYLLWDPARNAKSFIVRLGIYSGTALAIQYSLLTMFALDVLPSSFFILLAYLLPISAARFHRWLTSKWDASLVNAVLIGLGIVALISSMILLSNPLSPFWLILIFLGISVPFWCFLIALQASRWLWKYHETKLTFPRGLGILAWLSAYAFALRFDILKMFELYNALPTQPPDCYIATAAAKGHPHFVGSWTTTLANGKSIRVNRQMQRLKALEIVLMAVSATSHKWMRSIYDVAGKRLAMHIQNPLLADAAFFILIPAEWISVFVLQLVVPEIRHLSGRLYHS